MSLNNVKKVLSNLGWEFKITYKDKTIQSENYLKMTRTKIGIIYLNIEINIMKISKKI